MGVTNTINRSGPTLLVVAANSGGCQQLSTPTSSVTVTYNAAYSCHHQQTRHFSSASIKTKTVVKFVFVFVWNARQAISCFIPIFES